MTEERLPENVAVRIEDLHVRFKLPHENIRSIKQHAVHLLTRRMNYEEHHVIKGLNLDIKTSQVYGLIGENGAGKSTLLKMVARVLPPQGGRIRVQGRVAPLLGLGAGFHEDLTGMENVFLNGVLLGLTRSEVYDLYDEIVDFAELHDFMDSPLRVYSAGMRARLGFSIAVTVKPDIIILDEVLAVGDEAFREKCHNKIREICSSNMTVIVVSHSMGMVKKLCTEVAWLYDGVIRMQGEAEPVVDAYLAYQKEKRRQTDEAQ